MKAKFILTAVVFASVAFWLSAFNWVGLPESVAFGLGISFLIYGWPLLTAAYPQFKALDRFAFLAIVWGLVSRWIYTYAYGGGRGDILGPDYWFSMSLMFASALA